MLVNFKFKNFKSFYNLNELSLQATKDNELKEINTFNVDENLFNKIEALLHQPEMKTIDSYQNYLKLSECFFEIVALSNNAQSNREDYLKALNLQNVLIEKMIEYVRLKTKCN